jgi:hypothetical protein
VKKRQARKIIARGMMLTAQETPWKDSTLEKAVEVFMRRPSQPPMAPIPGQSLEGYGDVVILKNEAGG